MSGPIDLVHVDEHIVVADKPSGLSVHRGWDGGDDFAMFRVRDAIGAWVFPVHRLDRGTSGILLFARSSEGAATIAAAFEHGAVEKTYLALVRGVFPDSAHIDYPIPKSEDGERVPAVTDARRLGASPIERCSLVEARPRTGRLHQVRRHLKHLAHPLIGDVAHGSGAINRHYRATYGFHRLALHASSLTIAHPVTGTKMTFSAPLPADFADVLGRVGIAVPT